jgi:hypothetical protein
MGTEKQEKHVVSITFLFTSEGHEAIWEPWILFFWTSDFLTRLDTNSYRQGLVWDFCLSSLELSHKARCQLTQARSHCWLWPCFKAIFLFKITNKNQQTEPDMVAHSCNTRNAGAIGRRISVQCQCCQKAHNPIWKEVKQKVLAVVPQWQSACLESARS